MCTLFYYFHETSIYACSSPSFPPLFASVTILAQFHSLFVNGFNIKRFQRLQFCGEQLQTSSVGRYSSPLLRFSAGRIPMYIRKRCIRGAWSGHFIPSALAYVFYNACYSQNLADRRKEILDLAWRGFSHVFLWRCRKWYPTQSWYPTSSTRNKASSRISWPSRGLGKGTWHAPQYLYSLELLYFLRKHQRVYPACRNQILLSILLRSFGAFFRWMSTVQRACTFEVLQCFLFSFPSWNGGWDAEDACLLQDRYEGSFCHVSFSKEVRSGDENRMFRILDFPRWVIHLLRLTRKNLQISNYPRRRILTKQPAENISWCTLSTALFCLCRSCGVLLHRWYERWSQIHCSVYDVRAESHCDWCTPAR